MCSSIALSVNCIVLYNTGGVLAVGKIWKLATTQYAQKVFT